MGFTAIHAVTASAADVRDLRSPVEFQFSGSLEIQKGEAAPAPLRLAEPALSDSRAGVDALLERVAPGRIHSGEMARKAIGLPAEPKPLTGPTPVPSPRATPLAFPAPMKLSTRLVSSVRTLGEFKTRDWNALGGVTPLAGPEPGSGGTGSGLRVGGGTGSGLQGGTGSGIRMVLPNPDVLRLSAPPELIQALGTQVAGTAKATGGASGAAPVAAPSAAPSAKPVVEPSDMSPLAMKEAEAALAEAQARGMRRAKGRARGGEPLMVLPDFGASSFQVGASFSLAGRSAGRIGFGENAVGSFGQDLSGRQGFGLTAPGAGESLRLGNPDEPAPTSKSAKDDADKRLWTGVVFNF